MKSPADFEIHWRYKLKIRVMAILMAMFLLALFVIILIAKTLGEDLIERQAYANLADAGHRVVAELERRTVHAEALADSIARVGASLPAGQSEFTGLITAVMNNPRSQHLIAGGGVWPEPYEFRPERDRDSFFWGRDEQGGLLFYDGYNRREGAGYHQEEWYVPAKYLRPGSVYWSRSYTDRHSLQPMVTVSVPMMRRGERIGVATIDLKLEGLRELLGQATSPFGGYAYAVDRNGRFLAFPNDSMAQYPQGKEVSGSLISYMDINELAYNEPAFRSVAAVLEHHREAPLTSTSERVTRLASLADSLTAQSYQIEKNEAPLIAAALLDPTDDLGPLQLRDRHLRVKQDYFLNEPVFVSITSMPDTNWRIVTVMPQSAARKDVAELFWLMIGGTITAVLGTMLLVWYFLRRSLTQPLANLADQLKNNFSDSGDSCAVLETSDKGELGAVAHWFNARSEQLLESQRQVKQLAFFDALTGLPNRRLLLDRLRQKLVGAKRKDAFGALLFIDLDNFKDLNDSLGHSVGDKLLLQVGQRLQHLCREEDTIARLGGDEFVVVIGNETHHAKIAAVNASAVAKRIIDTLSKPFELAGNRHHVSASIGVSLFSGEQQDVEIILKQADTAMYQAKASGRNHYCFFEMDMQQRADERLRIQGELRHAIASDQLRLFYQPQLDADGDCLSVEALIRWQHPQKGLVPPGDFIGIAEESTLILKLGSWVLYEACRQISGWNKQGLKLHHVSVNVSPRQFQQHDFIEVVQSAIKQAGIPSSQLMLEITEGVIFENTEAAIAKMHALRNLGVSISMDDFGTGYSSLTYLKKLPLDQLKIDQSFVREIDVCDSDAVIVEAIISMAQQLGYEVIAEGVETKEQLAVLAGKGCTYYQGYYFSPPLAVSGFVEYLQQQGTMKL
ncbi:MAG: EAL domain-containing protein [Pseudomonadales bacterium]